ncbi:MAG: hypothetical protein JWN86_3602 [Planctomycetota bacterium]|nr:hypothetical protein [Planctomycetota bacterium]
MAAILLKLFGIVVPLMPLVRWPVAARLMPKLQEMGKDLYETAWMLGFTTGANLGITVGIAIGAVSATAVIAICYWSFFKPVR